MCSSVVHRSRIDAEMYRVGLRWGRAQIGPGQQSLPLPACSSAEAERCRLNPPDHHGAVEAPEEATRAAQAVTGDTTQRLGAVGRASFNCPPVNSDRRPGAGLPGAELYHTIGSVGSQRRRACACASPCRPSFLPRRRLQKGHCGSKAQPRLRGSSRLRQHCPIHQMPLHTCSPSRCFDMRSPCCCLCR